jgi:hypothetical protein
VIDEDEGNREPTIKTFEWINILPVEGLSNKLDERKDESEN